MQKTVLIQTKLKRKFFIKNFSHIVFMEELLKNDAVWHHVVLNLKKYRGKTINTQQFCDIVEKSYYEAKEAYLKKSSIATNKRKQHKNIKKQKQYIYRTISNNQPKTHNYRLGYVEEQDNYFQQKYINIGQQIIDGTSIIPEVNIYRGFLTIDKYELGDRLLKVYDITCKNIYEIFIAYHQKTNKIYLDEKYHSKLLNKQIYLNINYKLATSSECTNPLDEYFDFNPKSKLALYGYKVGKTNGLQTQQRHQILSFIIDNNIMSRSNIISLLQGNISLREWSAKDFKQALNDWEEDIIFVHEYKK